MPFVSLASGAEKATPSLFHSLRQQLGSFHLITAMEKGSTLEDSGRISVEVLCVKTPWRLRMPSVWADGKLIWSSRNVYLFSSDSSRICRRRQACGRRRAQGRVRFHALTHCFHLAFQTIYHPGRFFPWEIGKTLPLASGTVLVPFKDSHHRDTPALWQHCARRNQGEAEAILKHCKLPEHASHSRTLLRVPSFESRRLLMPFVDGDLWDFSKER